MTHVLVDEFTVIGARNRGNKPNPHGGELTKWYVDLQDSSGQPVKNEAGKVADAYWQRKAGSEVTPGDKVYGKVEEGEHGLRFKLEQKPDGNGAGSTETSSGGKRDWTPESQRDPERAARILRQHSQEMALRYCALLGDRVPLDQIFRIANQFDADVNQAGQTSNPTQDLPGQGDTSPPPAPPASDSSVSREHQEICEALDTAGLLYPAAKDFVADYMLSELPPERIKKAVGNLVGQDLELQAQTLSALRASAESHAGKLVPVPEDEPFPNSEPVF